jgi:hypothetical protein
MNADAAIPLLASGARRLRGRFFCGAHDRLMIPHRTAETLARRGFATITTSGNGTWLKLTRQGLWRAALLALAKIR